MQNNKNKNGATNFTEACKIGKKKFKKKSIIKIFLKNAGSVYRVCTKVFIFFNFVI
jgi:hypothetical protein